MADEQTRVTTVRGVFRRIIKQIIDMGYNVYVSYSRKSKSRYLEMSVSKAERWIIRISDHPPNPNCRYTFDIHIGTPRPQSIDYQEFVAILRYQKRRRIIISTEKDKAILILRETLLRCADIFEAYAGIHAKKDAPEADEKSKRNKLYADMCRKVLVETEAE